MSNEKNEQRKKEGMAFQSKLLSSLRDELARRGVDPIKVSTELGWEPELLGACLAGEKSMSMKMLNRLLGHLGITAKLSLIH